MSGFLIAIVTAIYLGVAASDYLKQDYAGMVIFIGYDFANLGLIMRAI